MLMHTPPAAWCEQCVRGHGAAKPHKVVAFDTKDIAKARVVMDYAYLKTDGEFAVVGKTPPVAD